MNLGDQTTSSSKRRSRRLATSNAIHHSATLQLDRRITLRTTRHARVGSGVRLVEARLTTKVRGEVGVVMAVVTVVLVVVLRGRGRDFAGCGLAVARGTAGDVSGSRTGGTVSRARSRTTS